MTKQIHTKTVLKDGKEHTTVHEETNVQEDDAPDELRESMQDIINQFMDQPVQQEKQDTSHETEIWNTKYIKWFYDSFKLFTIWLW